MRFYSPLPWLSISLAASQLAGAQVQATLLEALDEALLNDIIEQYDTHDPSTCTTAASESATSFSSAWPGKSATSNWDSSFVNYEESLFQTVMTHTDTTGNNLSWSIRIGTGGNMYSHYTPNMYGETMPPQRHDFSPWIDEVWQSVSVNSDLNKNLNRQYPDYCPASPSTAACSPFYIHQAGAYQKDSPNTDTPFYSPSLAKHCSGNSCIFASWGTHAHVPTPFTSAVIYINKYTNCDNGVIEHTQMIHNFAPLAPKSSSIDVDLTYFNVGWGGVRASNLPYALEPSGGTLSFTDVENTDYLKLCQWGLGDHDKPGIGRGERADLKNLGGYTTFVSEGLLVNHPVVPIVPWCRKASDPDCSINEATCMKAACTDDEVAAGATRMELKVAAGQTPNCVYSTLWNNKYVQLKCDMRDQNFGRTGVHKTSSDPCVPWVKIGFKNRDTGNVLEVAYVAHWSWSPTRKWVHFAVFETDKNTAIAKVNAMFDNTGGTTPLFIDVVSTPDITSTPADYDPSDLSTFTHVYGKGAEYGSSVDGQSRRRVGSTYNGGLRDYTVFTINWWHNGARLQAGSTYSNRSFMFSSALKNVKATADGLVDETIAAEIGFSDWSPRKVDIYTQNADFAVVVASSATGDSTTCGDARSLLSCSGFSTPQANYDPIFHVICGSETYLGFDPYHFTPSFDASFPAHGSVTKLVRSYQCGDQSASVRPSWKLMGFFDSTDSCWSTLSVTNAVTYNEDICPPGPPPTSSPSKTPSAGPTTQPTVPPPTTSPSSTPTSSPSKTPSTGPTTQPTVPPPTTSPSSTPTSSPSKAPSAGPTTSPTVPPPTTSPSSTPTSSPSKTPSTGPTTSPTIPPSTTSPTTPPPTTSPSTSPPSTTPSKAPSKAPVTVAPTKSPNNLPGTPVSITGTTTLSGVDLSSFNDEQKEEFKDVLKQKLQEEGCPTSNIHSCIVEILQLINVSQSRRLRSAVSPGISHSSRQLLSSAMKVEYRIVIEAICSSSDCSDAVTVANQLYEQVTGDLRVAIDNGSVVSSIQETSSVLATLLQDATASGDFSPVVIPILALLSKWYPDWRGASSVCLNDGKAPLYIKVFGTYYESSLDACCARFFSWDIYTCTGDSGTVPGGFYPAWDGTETKCSNSTETAEDLPDYMRDSPGQWLDDDIESCCERHYNWAYSSCISLSGGDSSAPATGNWYVNHEKEMCHQDCPKEVAGPCGGLVKPWDTLYGTAAICCAEQLSWVASPTCESKSNLTIAVGTSYWYVDWALEKCVKDCDDSSDANCGGLAERWDELYGSSSSECCDRIWYIERNECTVE